MNVENILKVADAIENHKIPWLGFNMEDYVSTDLDDKSGHNCGTVACIAGWAAAVNNLESKVPPNPNRTRRGEILGGDIVWAEESVQVGAEFMGLDYGQYEELFHPSECNWETIDPEKAVRTLRHLAATGEVDWTV